MYDVTTKPRNSFLVQFAILLFLCFVLSMFLSTCSNAEEEAPAPADAAVPSTTSPVPPTATPILPTATPVPTSATPLPSTLNPLQAAMTEQALAREVATPRPTSTPVPTSCDVIQGICLWLSFDGESCTYEGLTEFASGQVTLLFKNESEVQASPNLWLHNEGRSFQDMIDYIGPEPSTLYHPPWSTSIFGVAGAIEAGRSLAWEGVLHPGNYTIVCYRRFPHGLWYGFGLTVEE